MANGTSAPHVLRTTAGDLALHEYSLRLDGRAWRILHTGAVLSSEDEGRFLTGEGSRLPYGIVLWPAAIALAHVRLYGREAAVRLFGSVPEDAV